MHEPVVGKLAVGRCGGAFGDGQVKLYITYLLRVVLYLCAAFPGNVEHALGVVELLHVLHILIRSVYRELAETFQHIKQRHGRVLHLLVVHGCTLSGKAGLSLQRTVYAADVLKEFQL